MAVPSPKGQDGGPLSPHVLHSGAWDGLKGNGHGGAKAQGQPRPPVAGRDDDEPGLNGGGFTDGPLE
jgi:hypothetical protein